MEANVCSSHIAPNSMRLLIFHGPQKKLDAKDYLTSDIVLTTYSTLASDCQTIGILRRLKWFRIVLDEGESPNVHPGP
jgi:SNF2 family DNA or RNA helicase